MANVLLSGRCPDVKWAYSCPVHVHLGVKNTPRSEIRYALVGCKPVARNVMTNIVKNARPRPDLHD
jgi:hypothetical protein